MYTNPSIVQHQACINCDLSIARKRLVVQYAANVLIFYEQGSNLLIDIYEIFSFETCIRGAYLTFLKL